MQGSRWNQGLGKRTIAFRLREFSEDDDDEEDEDGEEEAPKIVWSMCRFVQDAESARGPKCSMLSCTDESDSFDTTILEGESRLFLMTCKAVSI